MFISRHDIGFMKRFTSVWIALAFLIANIAPSYAQNLTYQQRGATSFAGHAAMLGVRIPFGGERTVSSRPIVGLMVGPSWQATLGSTGVQGYRFNPTIEAGLSLRGEPVLRLSTFNVRLDQLRASAEGAEGGTFCGRNLAVCILGGVAIVAVVVALAVGSDDCEPSDLYPPGQDPCMCFEPDGCKS